MLDHMRSQFRNLTPAQRREVRRAERTGRSTGIPPLDAIAVADLERIADSLLPYRRKRARDRLERLRSTLRHPSRCGAPLDRHPSRAQPGPPWKEHVRGV
jgi:hypothetical protein